jgi:hypothetical protein
MGRKNKKQKKTSPAMSAVQTYKLREKNDREMHEIIDSWKSKTTDAEAQLHLTSIVNSAKNVVALGGSRNEFFARFPEMAPKVVAISENGNGAASQLREIAEMVEFYTFGLRDSTAKLEHMLDELTKVDSKKPIGVKSIIAIERESRLGRGEDTSKRLINVVMREALVAKTHELKPKDGRDQGVFTDFPEIRDSIIRVATDESRTFKARSIEISDLLQKLVTETKTRIPKEKADLKRLEGEIVLTKEQLEKKNIIKELLDRLDQAEYKGWVLQSNDCSRLHKLYESVKEKRLAGMLPPGYEKVQTHKLELAEGYIPFIVKHNWAAVLGDSTGDKEGSVLPPAPKCAFEFRISGFNVIYLIQDPTHEGFKPLFKDEEATLFVEASDNHWVILTRIRSLFKYVHQQFEAACIVLESRAATSVLTEAPAALNKKRRAQGKLPLYDFHTIDLSREKKRYIHHGDGEGTGTKMRLHFVRAHDRHYKDKGITVRIGWHLRGDSSLGFVDKLYKL